MTFNVQVQPAGRQFEVSEGETILDAAERQNVALPYGCRNGACGACVAQLDAGRVDYPSGKTGALEGLPAGSCLTCQAVPVSDLTLTVEVVEQLQELPVRTLPCRVEHAEQLAHDVMRVELKLPDNQRLQFMAGQYLDFILADGRRRAFSIANAPHDDGCIELHIRHVEGGEFTQFVFDGLKEKTIMRIQAPLGSFVVREQSERPMLFVAGGTGFAPIKGMIEHILHSGIDRPLHLYWGVRSSRDLYLPELPLRWAAENPQIHYVPVLSEPDEGWTGRSGYVHEAVVADHPDMSGFDVYMAGPPVMVHAGRDAFRAAGLADEYMFSDAFEWAKDK